MILIIPEPASSEEIKEMLKTWEVFIKRAVDIERKVIAGGSVCHYECEQELLKDSSRQREIWGADWSHSTQEFVFESIINIRPSQNNRALQSLGVKFLPGDPPTPSPTWLPSSGTFTP